MAACPSSIGMQMNIETYRPWMSLWHSYVDEHQQESHTYEQRWLMDMNQKSIYLTRQQYTSNHESWQPYHTVHRLQRCTPSAQNCIIHLGARAASSARAARELLGLFKAQEMNSLTSRSLFMSTPCLMPRPLSMYTTSSVATFPAVMI